MACAPSITAPFAVSTSVGVSSLFPRPWLSSFAFSAGNLYVVQVCVRWHWSFSFFANSGLEEEDVTLPPGLQIPCALPTEQLPQITSPDFLPQTTARVKVWTLGQHEPAPNSAPVGNSVPWMGWDFSSSGWMCLDLCWPIWCWPCLWGFFCWLTFFPTLRSPAQLCTTYPLRINSPPALSPTYLLNSHPLFPPKFITSFLPTYPPSYLPTQHHITSMATNENKSNAGIAFIWLIIN
jgi:hypothetical protein